jgi:hypothetical protein
MLSRHRLFSLLWTVIILLRRTAHLLFIEFCCIIVFHYSLFGSFLYYHFKDDFRRRASCNFPKIHDALVYFLAAILPQN